LNRSAAYTCGIRYTSASPGSSPKQNPASPIICSTAASPWVIQWPIQAFTWVSSCPSSRSWLSTLTLCSGWMSQPINAATARAFARATGDCGNSAGCG